MSKQSDIAEIEEDCQKGKTPKARGICILQPGHMDEESCDCHQNYDGELSGESTVQRL